MPQGRREEMVQGTAPRAALRSQRSCWQVCLEVDLPCQLQGQHGQSAPRYGIPQGVWGDTGRHPLEGSLPSMGPWAPACAWAWAMGARPVKAGHRGQQGRGGSLRAIWAGGLGAQPPEARSQQTGKSSAQESWEAPHVANTIESSQPRERGQIPGRRLEWPLCRPPGGRVPKEALSQPIRKEPSRKDGAQRKEAGVSAYFGVAGR